MMLKRLTKVVCSPGHPQAAPPVTYKGEALFKQIKQACKSLLGKLCAERAKPESYHEGKAVYISELGLYQLIFSLRLKLADKIHSCYLVHCPVLHGNFMEEELISMGKSAKY